VFITIIVVVLSKFVFMTFTTCAVSVVPGEQRLRAFQSPHATAAFPQFALTRLEFEPKRFDRSGGVGHLFQMSIHDRSSNGFMLTCITLRGKSHLTIELMAAATTTMKKMKSGSTEGKGEDSSSQLIDAKKKELSDRRGETLAQIRMLITDRPTAKWSRSGSGEGFRCGHTPGSSAPARPTRAL
jgi:hypothetical protein